MTDVSSRIAGIVRRLVSADAPQEGLGRYAAPGRLIRRAPRIERVGSAWRLGTLLVTPDGEVLAVGEVLRAAEEVRRGYTAESARTRADQRAAAVRGGFRPGEVVHVGWTVVDLDAVARGEPSGPLQPVDGMVMVRWSAAGGLAPLDAYLEDRLALLLEPPERA